MARRCGESPLNCRAYSAATNCMLCVCVVARRLLALFSLQIRTPQLRLSTTLARIAVTVFALLCVTLLYAALRCSTSNSSALDRSSENPAALVVISSQVPSLHVSQNPTESHPSPIPASQPAFRQPRSLCVCACVCVSVSYRIVSYRRHRQALGCHPPTQLDWISGFFTCSNAQF